MVRYRDNPMTPNMRKALKYLASLPEGESSKVSCVGQPTRYRLVKFGYAEFTHPSEALDALLLRRGDWPMRITEHGRSAIRTRE